MCLCSSPTLAAPWSGRLQCLRYPGHGAYGTRDTALTVPGTHSSEGGRNLLPTPSASFTRPCGLGCRRKQWTTYIHCTRYIPSERDSHKSTFVLALASVVSHSRYSRESESTDRRGGSRGPVMIACPYSWGSHIEQGQAWNDQRN